MQKQRLRWVGLSMALVMGIGIAGTLLPQEPVEETLASHYDQGMELWRHEKAAEALPHLMTATEDHEVSFYAARQVSLMGRFALPVLHQGLWHRDERIQRQSAIILGWIGDKGSLEPLLFRMKYPEAPLEVEYALQKIGAFSGSRLIDILGPEDLAQPALLDRKIASVARLADSLRLAVDPEPLLDWVETIETAGAGELSEQPFGHLANARMSLLLFLAGRKVAKVAPHLVGAFQAGADDENLALARALVTLGAPSLEPLDAAFRSSEDPLLRPLLAVAHYFAAGAPELSASPPIAVALNEAQSKPSLARQLASLAARFSTRPNPLLNWFNHHPDPEVRRALAPEDLSATEVASRAGLKRFHLDKTLDPEPGVSLAHLSAVVRYLPDPEVESRVKAMVADHREPAVGRRAALEATARHGVVETLLDVIRSPEDPLRARAVELAAMRTEPEIISAVLAVLGEPDASDAKRAALSVAAERWKRPEAVRPLLEILRSGDPLWREAARGLAALGVSEAAEPFVAMIDAGRSIGADEAGALYFSFTGLASRLVGDRPGAYRFEPLLLGERPPPGQVLVVLEERTDYRGWVKVEERWGEERAFRLDEGKGELWLYDRDAYDRMASGAGIILLEEVVRQTVLNPLEVSEFREQKVTVIGSFPHFPFAGLAGDRLQLVHQGAWIQLPLGKDLREESDPAGWGRSALVPLRFFDRDRVRFSERPPPSGWLRDEPQPIPTRR